MYENGNGTEITTIAHQPPNGHDLSVHPIPNGPSAAGPPPGYYYYGYSADRPKQGNRILQKVLRHKLVLVSVFLLVGTLGLATYQPDPPKYRSEAAMEVDSRTFESLSSMSEVSYHLGFHRYLANQRAILTSRPLAEAVAEKQDPEKLAAVRELSQPRTGWLQKKLWALVNHVLPENKAGTEKAEAQPEPASVPKDTIVKEVMAGFSVEPVGRGGSLLKLSVVSHDPELARSMLQDYIDVYIAQNTAKRKAESSEVLKWLAQEVAEAEAKLLKSEEDLVQFVTKHGIVISERGGISHVAEMLTDRIASLSRAKEARARLEAIQSQSDKDDGRILPDEVRNEFIARIKSELADLESQEVKLAGVYSEDYPPRVLLRKKIALLRKRLSEVEQTALSSALKTAEQEEMLLKEVVDEAKQESLRINSITSQYTLLKRNAQTNRDIHRILLKEHKQLGIKARSVVNNIHVVDPPSTPTASVSGADVSHWLFVLIGGLIGGVLAALGVDSLDDTLKSSDTFEKDLDAPRLGVLPDIAKTRRLHHARKDSGDYGLLAYDRPRSPMSDAIRNIQASLFFSASNGHVKSMAVSSAVPGEGKTLVAVSLGTVLAKDNTKRVLILDCDFRRPSVHRVFGQPPAEVGLTTVLTDNGTDVRDLIQRHNNSGAHYIPAGPVPDDPVALLSSPKMATLFNELQEEYELIVCDCPPILGCPDTRFVSRLTEAVTLVARQGHVREAELSAAVAALSGIQQVKFLGIIVNGASGGHYSSRKYSSYYRYGSQT